MSPSSLTKAVPMPMPDETPSPCRTRSLFGLSPAVEDPSLLIETAADQIGERGDGAHRLGAAPRELDRGPRARREHHQSHDGPPRYGIPILTNGDFGIKLPGKLDEARGGPRMKAALVANGDGAPDRVGAVSAATLTVGIAHSRASARSCEATLMYFRPASCAPRTALASGSLCRKLASLISIGRLIPAITSILALSITEMARLEGVPPNMSVSSTTPSPPST